MYATVCGAAADMKQDIATAKSGRDGARSANISRVIYKGFQCFVNGATRRPADICASTFMNLHDDDHDGDGGGGGDGDDNDDNEDDDGQKRVEKVLQIKKNGLELKSTKALL